MQKDVQLLGLITGEVQVQGPAGPVPHSPTNDCPIAAFALPGWQAGDPEGERHGQAVLRDMEAVGRVRADGQVTPAEFGDLVARLELPGGQIVEVLVPVAQEAIRRLQDDGQLSREDQIAIARSAVAAIVRHFLAP